MQEIGALVAYFAMSFPHLLDGFLVPMGTPFLTSQRLLQRCQFLLAFAEVARVLYRASIRDRSKVQQAQINAYRFLALASIDSCSTSQANTTYQHSPSRLMVQVFMVPLISRWSFTLREPIFERHTHGIMGESSSRPADR